MKKFLPVFLFTLFAACTTPQKNIPTPVSTKVHFSLDELQRRTFFWFWDLAYADNWQTPDRWPSGSFSSIAATGFALSAYVIGAERGWVSRAAAADRVMKVLEVLKNLPQGEHAAGISGYRGFFYHFLDMKTAHRFKNVELSSIDTGLLMAGVLVAMSYFDDNNEVERNIRATADFLYRRVEWPWMLNAKQRLSMGWTPERGFLPADWKGYNEAMILNILALGSPTHPVPTTTWQSWCEHYYRAPFEGQDMVNFGPLFGHQYSHMFVDFRGIVDDYMRTAGFDYFENSRRATLAQRSYAIRNPQKFKGYSANIWGLTACDGPANVQKNAGPGGRWHFQTYSARGVAADYLVDDGTIAPTAVAASLPFAPEICLPALEALWQRYPIGQYGFFDAYNETFTWKDEWINGQSAYDYWVDNDYLGIDQGAILIQIENYRTGLIWNILKKNDYIVAGLRRAGFSGGWLDTLSRPPAETTGSPHNAGTPNPEVPIDPSGFFRRAIYFDEKNNALPYWLMPPPDTTHASKRFPLVVFLHGAGERGTRNHEQMKNGVYAFCEAENLKKYPCWLLVPQCPPEQSWSPIHWRMGDVRFRPDTMTLPGRLVVELIEKLLRENPSLDPSRVYLTGLSMGGFGTFYLAMSRPDLFAAIAPVCGGGDPTAAARLNNLPTWIFHGRLDEVVPSRFSEHMFEAMKKSGHPAVRYTEFSTLRHACWNEVYYNPALMEWLFSHRK